MSEQASGLLYQLNLVNEDSILAAADCVKKISAEKLETVRFLFVDQHGRDGADERCLLRARHAGV